MPVATMDQVSCNIHRALETIGVTQLRRQLHLKSSITHEISRDIEAMMDKLERNVKTSMEWHVFGSSIEGTTTRDLNSDIDTVVCMSFDSKGLKDECSLIEKYCCLLDSTSGVTPPGYTKLIENCPAHMLPAFEIKLASWSACATVPSTLMFERKRSANRKSYFSNCLLKLGLFKFELSGHSAYSTHGPATTYASVNDNSFIKLSNECTIDFVIGVQADFWPQCAIEWLLRERPRNWPSMDDISYLKTLGFFLVPVGHELSPEKDLEWRISFSKQERYLMLNLNDTQYKCYMLLKLVKEEIINSYLGKVLKSYVCKTSLFYTIEETDPAIWTNDRLLECFLRCVQKLLSWAEEGVCPNYFIPEENMFEGKVFGDAKMKLCQILSNILSKPLEALLYIKLDNFGMILSTLHQDETSVLNLLEKLANIDICEFVHGMIYHIGNCLGSIQRRILKKMICPYNQTPVKCLKAHSKAIDFLQSFPVSREPHAVEKQDFITVAVESVRCSLASHLVAIAINCPDLYLRDWYMCTAAINFYMSAKGDVYGSRIKLATALYMTGHLASLKTMLPKIEPVVENVLAGGCWAPLGIYNMHWMFKNADNFDHTMSAVLAKISLRQILNKRVCTCVMFLPSELAVTPDPLRYEMFRSVGAPVGPNVPEYKKWYEWAVVDAKIMFVFLRAVVEGSSSNRSMFDIEKEVNPFSLCHTETAYNIIGWILKNIRRDSPINAGIMYGHSIWYLDMKKNMRTVNNWEKRELIPRYNAAYWHMLVLIYQTWTSRQASPLQH